MKKYKCHKVVMAGKIKSIVTHPPTNGQLDQVVDISFVDGTSMRFGKKWVDKFKPELHGYIVQYKDGYKSCSPQKAFEEGYSLMEVGEHD